MKNIESNILFRFHSFSFSTFAIAFTLHLKTMSGNVLSFHKIFDILLLLD